VLFERVKIIILKETNGDLSSWTVLSPSVGLLFFLGDARGSAEATERHEREHWILSEESQGIRSEI